MMLSIEMQEARAWRVEHPCQCADRAWNTVVLSGGEASGRVSDNSHSQRRDSSDATSEW